MSETPGPGRPSSAERARTLPELLARAGRLFPHRGVTLLDRRGREARRSTWPEVEASARSAAGRLAAAGVGAREPVALCLPTSWELVELWLGAVVRGAWPVTIAPGGTLGASEQHLRDLEDVVERLGAARLVTGPRLRDEIRRREIATLRERTLTPDELDADAPIEPGEPAPEDVAFLQLTSGSTGRRRAVVIPHSAAVHNTRVSDEAIGAPFSEPASAWADSMVSWLPLHHDMGLVGCLLFSASCGFDLTLMPPEAFLARPNLWLRKLAESGTTIAPAPSFAYQLCVERLDAGALGGADLSGWRAAMVGAEMVRPDTTAAFCEALSPHGFRPEAFRPCYGLAEGTLAVTFDQRGEGVRTRALPEGGGADVEWGLAEVACNGTPVRDTEVIVAAPDGTELPEGRLGEVRVRGPGVFRGYDRDEEATSETLRDGWLCTGDVGFLHDGELYLAGRRKEVLILKGHNVMPHEIEWLAESAAGGGGAARCGAFSIARGAAGEEAVLVMEAAGRGDAALAGLEHEVRSRVGRELSLPLADVVFVRRGRLPKTTSGKVRRRELRRLYLEGELERIAPPRE